EGVASPCLPRGECRRVKLSRCGDSMTELRDLFSPQIRRVHFVHGKRQRFGWQSLQRQVGAQDAVLLPRPRDGEVFPHILAITEKDTQQDGRFLIPGPLESQPRRSDAEQDGGMTGGLKGEGLFSVKANGGGREKGGGAGGEHAAETSRRVADSLPHLDRQPGKQPVSLP